MARIMTWMSIAVVLSHAPLRAQETGTLLPHSADAKWWLSGQANFILQWHGEFTSPYQGPNSLRPEPEQALSHLLTLRTGVHLTSRTEVVFDLESAGGRGISEALGLAGFTNLDVVRNPNLGPVPYLARVELHQTIGLSSKLVESDRGPFSLATEVPERRLELRVGKLGIPDFFDLNSV